MTQLTLMDAINATLPAPVFPRRVDPAQRMARFYRLAIEPTFRRLRPGAGVRPHRPRRTCHVESVRLGR